MTDAVPPVSFVTSTMMRTRASMPAGPARMVIQLSFGGSPGRWAGRMKISSEGMDASVLPWIWCQGYSAAAGAPGVFSQPTLPTRPAGSVPRSGFLMAAGPSFFMGEKAAFARPAAGISRPAPHAGQGPVPAGSSAPQFLHFMAFLLGSSAGRRPRLWRVFETLPRDPDGSVGPSAASAR